MISSNLYITDNLISFPGANTIIVNILLFLSLVCAIYTILSKNPVISVLFLIGLYINIASYLILIGSQFIGLSYLLIYIGAISILFIFILMLINIRISELLSNNRNSIPLVLIITIVLNNVLYSILPTKNLIYNIINNNDYYYFSQRLFNVIENNEMFINCIEWDNCILGPNTIVSLGNTLYTNYSILLILVSFILLLAMVGAIIITIKPSEK